MTTQRSLLVVLLMFQCGLVQAAMEESALEQRLQQMEQRLSALERQLSESETVIAEQEATIKTFESRVVGKEVQQAAGLTEKEKEALTTLARLEPILYQAQEKIGYHYGRPDRYIPVPGTDSALEFGGHIWQDIIYNSREMFNLAGFNPASMPTVNQRKSSTTTYSAGQSKFYVKSFTPTEWGDMKTRLEFDLFQSDGSSDFNLTHLWGELGAFGAGQTFSNFMDIKVFPNVIDYWGPNAMVFARQPQIRYTHRMGDSSQFAVSLEDPNSDITLPDGASADGREGYPDLTVSYQTEGDWGHFRVGGLLRQIAAEANDGGNRADEDMGWGVNLTGSVTFAGRDRIVGQLAFGDGFSRYMSDPCCSVVGGNDAAMNDEGELEAIEIVGGFIYLDHWWSDRWSSSIGASYAEIEPVKFQVDEAYDNSLYTSANLIWYPADPLKIGFEVIYGEVEDKIGRSSKSTRYMSSFSFKY